MYQFRYALYIYQRQQSIEQNPAIPWKMSRAILSLFMHSQHFCLAQIVDTTAFLSLFFFSLPLYLSAKHTHNIRRVPYEAPKLTSSYKFIWLSATPDDNVDKFNQIQTMTTIVKEARRFWMSRATRAFFQLDWTTEFVLIEFGNDRFGATSTTHPKTQQNLWKCQRLHNDFKCCCSSVIRSYCYFNWYICVVVLGSIVLHMTSKQCWPVCYCECVLNNSTYYKYIHDVHINKNIIEADEFSSQWW